MPESEVAQLLQDTFVLTIKLAGPPLLAAMGAGLVMSLFQAVTQINEPTMTFVPKAAAVAASLAVAGSFMWTALLDYSHDLLDRLVAAGGW